MNDSHPTQEDLRRLTAGTLTDPAVQRTVASHLGRRCPTCLAGLQSATDRLSAGASAAPPADPYPDLLLRVLERTTGARAALAGDAGSTMALWLLLERLPPAARLALAETDARFHQWQLAQRLLDTAADLAPDSDVEAAGLCHLALAIADRLPADRYPASLRQDLRARAWGLLGEALRSIGRLGQARQAFAHARLAADEGSGDDLDRASLQSLEANLRLDLGDLAGAAVLLGRAAAAFRLHHELVQEGHALYKLALVRGHERPELGAALARRALDRLGTAADPRLDLAVRHALIWFLNDAGQTAEALGLLDATRSLYRCLGATQPDGLLPWLEARLCRRLGHLRAAEQGLSTVWHALQPTSRRLELTLVTLDLVEAYLAQGRKRPALQLLTLFHARLASWRLHDQGRAAWALLLAEAAAGAERAQALIPGSGLYFRRAWNRPLRRRHTP